LAILFFWEYRGRTIDISIYIFDTRLRQIYSSSGRRYTLENVEQFFKNLLRDVPAVEMRVAEAHRRKLEEQCAAQPERCRVGAEMLARSKSPPKEKHDAIQSQPAGALKVGILPPAFVNPTLPSNIDKESDIYSEIRGYIRSQPSLQVSFDYGVGFGVGSSEVHAVWQGSVVKKVPDKTRMQAIGEDLGVDILVLAWITGNRANASIDLYVFDVARGRMHQGTDNVGQARGLVESTFALASASK
jgi:hypothetical protein